MKGMRGAQGVRTTDIQSPDCFNQGWVEAPGLAMGDGGFDAAENREVKAAQEQWETSRCNCCAGLRITKSLRIMQPAG